MRHSEFISRSSKTMFIFYLRYNYWVNNNNSLKTCVQINDICLNVYNIGTTLRRVLSLPVGIIVKNQNIQLQYIFL